MYDSLEKAIGEINNDDLRTMFETTVPYVILKDLDKARRCLEEYFNYDVPVHTGDIIDFNNKKYVVTCVYTDNTVDLLSEEATKVNIGLYQKEVTLLGRLHLIEVEV